MKRSRLRQVSKRRLDRDRDYQAARAQVFERSGGRCEVRAAVGCTGRCEQVHHKAGREGPEPHRLDNLVGCCHLCHGLIHQRPAWARAAGWSVSRLSIVDDEGEALEGGAA